MLELSGPLGGRPSLASSSAIRATSFAFTAISSSMRAISAAITASLSNRVNLTQQDYPPKEAEQLRLGSIVAYEWRDHDIVPRSSSFAYIYYPVKQL